MVFDLRIFTGLLWYEPIHEWWLLFLYSRAIWKIAVIFLSKFTELNQGHIWSFFLEFHISKLGTGAYRSFKARVDRILFKEK